MKCKQPTQKNKTTIYKKEKSSSDILYNKPEYCGLYLLLLL